MANTVNTLPHHQPRRIVGVAGTRMQRCRLMELGLVPGTLVAVVGVSPLGDPLEIAVRGYRLTIRRELAAAIEVAP